LASWVFIDESTGVRLHQQAKGAGVSGSTATPSFQAETTVQGRVFQ
jgi:hypothetical protein